MYANVHKYAKEKKKFLSVHMPYVYLKGETCVCVCVLSGKELPRPIRLAHGVLYFDD